MNRSSGCSFVAPKTQELLNLDLVADPRLIKSRQVVCDDGMTDCFSVCAAARVYKRDLPEEKRSKGGFWIFRRAKNMKRRGSRTE